MYTLPLLSLVFVQLLSLVTAQNKITLKVKKKIPFGKNILVKFTIPNPSDTNWLGVYKSTVTDPANADDMLWMYMCGNQDGGCEKEKGRAVFKIPGSDTTSNSDYPLNAGKYKVCLMNVTSGPDEDEVSEKLKCSPFQVKALNNNLVQQSSVTPTKTTYASGEVVSATYDSKTKTPNVWIGIFTPDEVTGNKLPHDDTYVYAACNNKEGNTDSELCSRRKKRGTVDFTEENLPGGTYVLCMCFSANMPYNKFVCSEEFEIGGDSELSLEVDSSIAYGSDIDVAFNNPDAVASNWIAIYESDETDDDNTLFWANMCGDKDVTDCSAKASGSVAFKASDPKTESEQQWPALPGNKKACLMEGDDSPYVTKICTEFTIEDLPSEATSDSSVDVDSESFDVGTAITAQFDAVVAIQNTWIGIYPSSDTDGITELPGEPLLWAYTACNNQTGDQETTNNCAATKTTGSIQMDENTGRSEGSWPIEAGTYKLCMSFNNNTPYDKFVCSDEFSVV